MFLICAIATLVDAGGTLIHLGRGAQEVNPLWAAAIDHFGAVSAMGLRVVVGLLLLSVLFAFWRRPAARFGLGLITAVFLPLTVYHLFLLIYVPLVS